MAIAHDADASRVNSHYLPWLVDAIGKEDFEVRLHDFLWHLCHADHFGIFRIGDGSASIVAADPTALGRERLAMYRAHEMWRMDPLMWRAMHAGRDADLCMVKTDMQNGLDSRARALQYDSIRDRFFLYRWKGDCCYALSVLRSLDVADAAPETGIDELQRCSPLLLSMLSKHYACVSERSQVRKALTCLDEIEHRIRSHVSVLPTREAAVCARLVYGMMVSGIALDLELSEESVKTYRKRLYRKLNVASARDLLVWYLELGHVEAGASSLPGRAPGSYMVLPRSGGIRPAQ